jgi:hypothetical protein
MWDNRCYVGNQIPDLSFLDFFDFGWGGDSLKVGKGKSFTFILVT